MFGNRFYHQTTRRYVATFGTLFNDIHITRNDNSGTKIQEMKVPIHYGPYQKFLSRLEQDPNLTAPAITLPRMSFNLVNMTYDPSRKLSSLVRNSTPVSGVTNTLNSQFAAIPYNMNFELNIMTKYAEDGTKILEQIIPFFTPDFTPSVKLLDDLDMTLDIPIILESIESEDTYEQGYQERRSLTWRLGFTMKGYFFGPVSQKKVIKFVEANMHDSLTSTDAFEKITIQPGLTANGDPTTDINQTVPYADIEFEDNWDYIVRIEDA